MKRVLIISPYFPPSNAADMQRVRMSLPYYREMGWDAEVVTVDQKHSDINKDQLLLNSVPEGIKVHQVGALPKKWTSKLGLGSIALRSLWFLKKQVDKLMEDNNFDLVYFSTTQFPVCVLGSYWKRKFGIPYVIDMQDPWHSEYYVGKPANERPTKYWFSYRMNKFLEPIAIKNVSGLISVSQEYIDVLKTRYHRIKHVPSETITFGASESDQKVAEKLLDSFQPRLLKTEEHFSLFYVGRGGKDMGKALSLFFSAFETGLSQDYSLFSKFRMYFIGTSYAAEGEGQETVTPIAARFGLEKYVYEHTARIPFFDGLAYLQIASGLFIPGSDDPAYTASKIFPYIMARKQILGIFHANSSVHEIVRSCSAGSTMSLDANERQSYQDVRNFLYRIVTNEPVKTDWTKFDDYTAKAMTRKQVELFNKALRYSNRLI